RRRSSLLDAASRRSAWRVADGSFARGWPADWNSSERLVTHIPAGKWRRQAMIARFFVDRPVFATVISVVLLLAGLVAAFTLPIAQYPEVTPPTVLVTASYPGANAQVVKDTVAAPIEEQVSGVEGMMYMSSRSTNDGAYNLVITFKLGTNADMAQVLVQN